MLKSGLIKGPKCLFLLEVFLQELEREFVSSELKNPADEQLRQCKFMLSVVGGFRLVLSCGFTSKNAAVLKQEVCPKKVKYSIRYYLPPNPGQ